MDARAAPQAQPLDWSLGNRLPGNDCGRRAEEVVMLITTMYDVLLLRRGGQAGKLSFVPTGAGRGEGKSRQIEVRGSVDQHRGSTRPKEPPFPSLPLSPPSSVDSSSLLKMLLLSFRFIPFFSLLEQNGAGQKMRLRGLHVLQATM